VVQKATSSIRIARFPPLKGFCSAEPTEHAAS